jgi:autotransporter-associated beta strand protein
MNNGVETGTQVIGDNPYEDTRNDVSHFANATYTWSGAEYLLYLNGQTGVPYPIGNNDKLWMDYPLKRLENGETDVPDAWWYSAQYNGGKTGILGHRDSKYYFGAPYLDGHKPCIFLARGIYTRHKMIAYDVDTNHKLIRKWRWDCNDRNSPWFGQGYHNYIIADVDEDGRDEIVYGSMVIDDNGKGLHTTGYGHGDAQHVRDFDPYRKGLEMFACLEEYPNWGSNYRNATTGEVYYKYTAPVTYTNGKMDDNDDGRCLAGNFFDDIPGSLGRSVGSGLVGLSRNVNGKAEELFSHAEAEPWVDYSWLNFRLYWDGDLLDEILDSPSGSTADNHEGAVIKYDRVSTNGKGTRLFNATGSLLNNSTKNNACFVGDILGDWREEFILRTGPTTMRLYTTVAPTTYPIYTLWHDHQYRQAMGTQMQVYNLPPNPSFFLGELEGYTVAPPPLTTEGRIVIPNGTSINSTYNGKHLLHNEYENTSLSVDGGTPSVLTINVPEIKSGTDENGTSGKSPTINTTTYTCTLSGALSGSTRLVKQGNGILNMANANHTHTGATNIWGGTVNFDGTMQNSAVWMNRHTVLNTTDGHFDSGLNMEYGATLNIGGASTGTVSSVNISTLTMNYGSRVILDVNGSGDNEHDWLNASTLNVDDGKVGIAAWENYGPEYIVPVFQINMQSRLSAGSYPLGNVNTVEGDLSTVVIECNKIESEYLSLYCENGVLYLQVSDVKTANKAAISITDMQNYADVATYYPSASPDDYYLPVVSVVAKNTNGLTPTLSGKFTALDGTETAIGSQGETILYNEDYTNTTGVSGWTTILGTNNFKIDNETGHGKYLLLDLGNNKTRRAYQQINSIDVSSVGAYSIEFDLAIKPGNTDPIEFCVMSKDGSIPTTEYDTYAYVNNKANMLFDLSENGTTTSYYVNGTTNTVTLASETWYHVMLNVNQQARTVAWSINGSSGTFNLPSGTSTGFNGFYLVAGKYYSKIKLDNIVIKTVPNDLSVFTFPAPGTLEVTSSLDGYASSTKTFEVNLPYYKIYGKNFNEITNANIAEVLGSNWNTTAQNTRWSYWSKTNSTYTDQYHAYWVVNNTEPISLCNDDEPQVVWMDSNNDYPAAVMESFGVGRNSSGAGATIHVENCGDNQTLVYYLVDNSRGNSPSTYGGFDKADINGGYTIAMDGNYTLAKLHVYIPVSIHDELTSIMPRAISTTGNAHLWRNGLAQENATVWATLVVPFDMTADNARAVFGDGTMVARLVTDKGDNSKIYFETTEVGTADDKTVVIHKNEPCLVRGVTKAAPYLIMGITSEPISDPQVGNSYFRFIGTYKNQGSMPFHLTDYFFTSDNGLSKVETDGQEMNLKGYRGYFQTKVGDGTNCAKTIQVLFDEPDSGIATNIEGSTVFFDRNEEVYDLQGRKLPHHQWLNRTLPKGIYIVGGKKMIVK